MSNRRAAFALERARAAGVSAEHLALRPYLDAGRTRADYDADLADLVARHRPDWVVLAGWMHVLSMAFLGRFPGRVVNLHPALPGCFPGGHAIDDAWAAHQRGDIDRTGVMVHLVPDEGVDDGPVLGHRRGADPPRRRPGRPRGPHPRRRARAARRHARPPGDRRRSATPAATAFPAATPSAHPVPEAPR